MILRQVIGNTERIPHHQADGPYPPAFLFEPHRGSSLGTTSTSDSRSALALPSNVTFGSHVRPTPTASPPAPPYCALPILHPLCPRHPRYPTPRGSQLRPRYFDRATTSLKTSSKRGCGCTSSTTRKMRPVTASSACTSSAIPSATRTDSTTTPPTTIATSRRRSIIGIITRGIRSVPTSRLSSVTYSLTLAHTTLLRRPDQPLRTQGCSNDCRHTRDSRFTQVGSLARPPHARSSLARSWSLTRSGSLTCSRSLARSYPLAHSRSLARAFYHPRPLPV
jgi:hypothetical protein